MVACGDCTSPFLNIYDTDLSLKKSYTITRQTLDAYTLTLNQRKDTLY